MWKTHFSKFSLHKVTPSKLWKSKIGLRTSGGIRCFFWSHIIQIYRQGSLVSRFVLCYMMFIFIIRTVFISLPIRKNFGKFYYLILRLSTLCDMHAYISINSAHFFIGKKSKKLCGNFKFRVSYFCATPASE